MTCFVVQGHMFEMYSILSCNGTLLLYTRDNNTELNLEFKYEAYFLIIISFMIFYCSKRWGLRIMLRCPVAQMRG